MKPNTRDFLYHRVGGRTVIISAEPDRGGESMITLNETGGIVWDMLCGGASEDDIVSAITGEYDAPADTVRADVRAVLQQMRERGLLTDE